MSVQFILGRSGTGKTSFCIRSIIRELTEGNPAENLVLLVPAQAADKPAKVEKKQIRVLLITGHDVPAHKWRETTPVLREYLEKAGKLEVVVCEEPLVLESSALDRYDAILLNTAIAKAGDPVSMGRAFSRAIEAGRLAYEAGLMEPRDMASPSTPVAGTPFFKIDSAS